MKSLRPWKRAHLAALLLVATALATATAGVSAQAQPSFDGLRIEQDETGLPYAVWLSWSPTIVTTGDGGAWAFFSADPLYTAEGEVSEAAGERGRLYAARFDPDAGIWQPAKAMPGGLIQFGPSAVVTDDGTVHLLFTDRQDEQTGSFGTLVYTRSDGSGGWSPPQPIAADPNAGHQLAASAVLDGTGQLHAVWQDQRAVDQAARETVAAHADIFASSLEGDAWTAPVQVSALPVPEENASRPHIAVAGDRLVAIWSVYPGVSNEQLQTAARMEWSSRALADPAWSAPQTLVEPQDGTEMGGRLLDVASHPEGGAVFTYGRRGETETTLFLRRFTGDAWGDDISVATGDRGSFPQAEVTSDGTAHVVYNIGTGAAGASNIHVGAITIAPDATEASTETNLTQGEAGAQGRPAISVAADGKIWVLYLHQPPGFSKASEVRCLRDAILPAPTT